MRVRKFGAGLVGLMLVAVACGRTKHEGPGLGNAGQADAGERSVAGSKNQGGSAVSVGGARADAGAPSDAGVTSVPAGGQSGAGGELSDDPPSVVGADCKGKPFELDAERVRQCVLLSGCGAVLQLTGECVVSGADPAATHFSGGKVTFPTQLDARAEGCIGTLRSCDDVMACTGERTADAECEADPTTRCDGDLAITCGDYPHVKDCRKLTGKSGACRVAGDGASARAGCAVDVQPSCNLNELGHTYCDGNVRYDCDTEGQTFGVDCAQFGLLCAEGAYNTTGFAQCVRPLAAKGCSTPGTGACNGTKIELCALGGVSFVRDCASVGGLTCFKGGGDGGDQDGPWFDCVPTGCYMRFETFDQCDGDDLLLAMDYTNRVKVHCADYGFRTCALAPFGAKCSN